MIDDLRTVLAIYDAEVEAAEQRLRERVVELIDQPGRDSEKVAADPPHGLGTPAPVSQAEEDGEQQPQASPPPPWQEPAAPAVTVAGDGELSTSAAPAGPVRESWGCPRCPAAFGTKHARDVHMGRAGHRDPAPKPMPTGGARRQTRPTQVMGWRPLEPAEKASGQ